MTPSDLEARDHALRCFDSGDFARAARLLVSLLARTPPDPVLLRLCGLALVRSGAAAQGLPYLARARRLAPQDRLAALWHGIGLHTAGRYADSAAALKMAARLAPDDSAPLIHLSRALLKLGRPRDGLEAARHALSLTPSLPEAEHAVCLCDIASLQASGDTTPEALAGSWTALGRACLRLDKVMDARAALTEAVGLWPEHSEAVAQLALVDHLCGQPLSATARLRAVLERDPGCLIARLHLASRLLLDDEAASALAVLDQVSTPPEGAMRARWQSHRAEALVALGRDDAARSTLDEVERAGLPELALPSSWQRHVLARRTRSPDAAILADRVERLASTRGSGTLEQRIDASFDLADLRQVEGRYADAFGHWWRGHTLLRAAQPFSRADHAAHIEQIVRHFDAKRLAEGPRSRLDDPAPVFIVGLPRTGTTLTEQILSAHPMVHGAGERLAVRETLSQLTGTKDAGAAMLRAAALTEAELTDAGRDYLAALHALAPDAKLLVDKMPDNVFQLGFIATLLPGARIICCTRDLRDVGASIFQHRFLGYHPYAHDLADLGWYMARHQALLAHWRASLPVPMLVIDHADWVENFETTLRRMLAFLDLPYDAACVRFFEQDRRVGSASRNQVRRPINAAGVGRWRRYSEQLAPMLRELPPDP